MFCFAYRGRNSFAKSIGEKNLIETLGICHDWGSIKQGQFILLKQSAVLLWREYFSTYFLCGLAQYATAPPPPPSYKKGWKVFFEKYAKLVVYCTDLRIRIELKPKTTLKKVLLLFNFICFYVPLRVIINLKNPQNLFYNVYFKSRQPHIPPTFNPSYFIY